MKNKVYENIIKVASALSTVSVIVAIISTFCAIGVHGWGIECTVASIATLMFVSNMISVIKCFEKLTEDESE